MPKQPENPQPSSPQTPTLSEVTQLLSAMNAGTPGAQESLLSMLYSELRSCAASYFRHARADHTLQPTALVHEAYIRILGTTSIEWEGRSHFLAVAAQAMRNVLADHARRRRAEKRGGGGSGEAWERVTLTGLGSDGGERHIDALDLEEALVALSAVNARLTRIVELRFYGGLSVEEVAQVLDVAPRTVELDWRMARAWLRARLTEGTI